MVTLYVSQCFWKVMVLDIQDLCLTATTIYNQCINGSIACLDKCMTAIHQGAGQRASHSIYEEVLGGNGTHRQKHTTETIGRCGMENKTQPPPGYRYTVHQTEWSIEEEEVQDLPSCQRQISQRQTSQQLVFSVWPVCKEHKPVVVICESTEMAIWYSTVPVWFNLVCSIRSHSLQFTTVALHTVQFQCYRLSVICVIYVCQNGK